MILNKEHVQYLKNKNKKSKGGIDILSIVPKDIINNEYNFLEIINKKKKKKINIKGKKEMKKEKIAEFGEVKEVNEVIKKIVVKKDAVEKKEDIKEEVKFEQPLDVDLLEIETLLPELKINNKKGINNKKEKIFIKEQEEEKKKEKDIKINGKDGQDGGEDKDIKKLVLSFF